MNDVKERTRRHRRFVFDAARNPRALSDGGGRRDRTDDLLLAKQALSQLSYGPGPVRVSMRNLRDPTRRMRLRWWAWEDLNFRPHAYQARALTN